MRRFQPVNFNVWNMLPLLARAAHQSRTWRAMGKHCLFSREEPIGEKRSNQTLATQPLPWDIASAPFHCQTPHPAHATQGSRWSLHYLLLERCAVFSSRRENIRASIGRKKQRFPALETR